MARKILLIFILNILLGLLFSGQALAFSFIDTHLDRSTGTHKACDDSVKIRLADDGSESITGISGDIVGSPQALLNSTVYYELQLEPLKPEDKGLGIREVCVSAGATQRCGRVVIEPNDYECLGPSAAPPPFVIYVGDDKNNNRAITGYSNPVYTNDPRPLKVDLYIIPGALDHNWELNCSQDGQNQQKVDLIEGDFRLEDYQTGVKQITCHLEKKQGQQVVASYTSSDSIFLDETPPWVRRVAFLPTNPKEKVIDDRQSGSVFSCGNEIALNIKADDGPKEHSSGLGAIEFKSRDGKMRLNLDPYSGGA